jgi:hypothetical protein
MVTGDFILGAWRLPAIIRRWASISLIVLAISPLFGCGKVETNRTAVHPVRGEIKFQNQIPVGAFVALHPKTSSDSSVPNPRATVATDGTFTLSTYDGQDGAPEGDYVLTVQWYKPVREGAEMTSGPNVIPTKYSSPRTSDIVVHVASGENQIKSIKIR